MTRRMAIPVLLAATCIGCQAKVDMQPEAFPIEVKAVPIEVPPRFYASASKYWLVSAENKAAIPMYVSWDIPVDMSYWELSVVLLDRDKQGYLPIEGLDRRLYRYRLNPCKPPHRIQSAHFVEVVLPPLSTTVWRMRPPGDRTFAAGTTPLFAAWGMSTDAARREGVIAIPSSHSQIRPKMLASLGDDGPPTGFWLFVTTKKEEFPDSPYVFGYSPFRTAVIRGEPAGGHVQFEVNGKRVQALQATEGGFVAMVPVHQDANTIHVSGEALIPLYVWIVREKPDRPHVGHRNDVVLRAAVDLMQQGGEYSAAFTFDPEGP